MQDLLRKYTLSFVRSALVIYMLILSNHLGNCNLQIFLFSLSLCMHGKRLPMQLMVTIKLWFIGHFSKDLSQTETFFVTVLHLCELQMPRTKNSQTQVYQIDQEKGARPFVSRHLKYLLLKLRVTFHFQGLYSINVN